MHTSEKHLPSAPPSAGGWLLVVCGIVAYGLISNGPVGHGWQLAGHLASEHPAVLFEQAGLAAHGDVHALAVSAPHAHDGVVHIHALPSSEETTIRGLSMDLDDQLPTVACTLAPPAPLALRRSLRTVRPSSYAPPADTPPPRWAI